jgi:hypothetical protein
MWDKKSPRRCLRGSGRAPLIELHGVYHFVRDLLDQGFPYLLLVAVVGRTGLAVLFLAANPRACSTPARSFFLTMLSVASN